MVYHEQFTLLVILIQNTFCNKVSSIYDVHTEGGGGGFTKKGLKMWTDVDAKGGGGGGLNGICGRPQEKNINF